jgi:hypothetical protein
MAQNFIMHSTHVEFETPTGLMKALSFADFKCLIDKAVEATEIEEPILLPSNCYLISRAGDNMKLSCYYPAAIREIEFIRRVDGKPKKHTIPFPNMILNFLLTKSADKWIVKSVYYYCTDKKLSQLPLRAVTTQDEGVWNSPMPNTFGDAHMCYGRNSMPSGFVDNFRGLDWYFSFLFSTPFNSDLNISCVKGTHPADWINELSGMTEFPYARLGK